MHKFQQKLATYTAIGRSLDPAYPSNRAIMAIVPITGLIGSAKAYLSGQALMSCVGAGLMLAIIVFLAWALGREIAPDHEGAASVAAFAALIAGLFIPVTDWLFIGQMIILLMLMRIVNRTVGPPARLGDSLIAFGAAAFMALSGAWLIALVAANAFLLDATLHKGQRHQMYFAALCVGLISAAWAARRISAPLPIEWPYLVPGLIMVALGIAYISRMGQLRVSCDVEEHSPDQRRVQAGVALMLAFGLFNGLWYGSAGLMVALPIWTTLAGVMAYALLSRPSTATSQPTRRQAHIN